MLRFRSRPARQAQRLCHHLRRQVRVERDRLAPEARDRILEAVAGLQSEIDAGAEGSRLAKGMTEAGQVAERWLPAHPHPALRENVEVFLVAISIAVAIHTFLLKPFKIPTGSMQPTLYGITADDLRERPEARIPGAIGRVLDYCLRGISYHHVVAETDGMLDVRSYSPPRMVLPFLYRQKFKVGETWYSVWSSWDRLLLSAGVQPRYLYHKGDDIVKVQVFAGDHLFVDRLSYNFRRPKRGEILVFETRGIVNPRTHEPAMPQDQYYIKRMVALGGERVRIGNDRHLVINDTRLDGPTPHFENVYSFDPSLPPRPNQYSGHVNEFVARQVTDTPIAPLFPDASTAFLVRPGHYLVMGDNTVDSYDGRAWGDFPRTNVIGRSFFVYWPFTRRFGSSVR